MQDLIARAEKIAGLLKHRGESVAVAESSTGRVRQLARTIAARL